jgi:hypothetical protein
MDRRLDEEGYRAEEPRLRAELPEAPPGTLCDRIGTALQA